MGGFYDSLGRHCGVILQVHFSVSWFQVGLELHFLIEYVEINLYQFFSPDIKWPCNPNLQLLECEKVGVANHRKKGHMEEMDLPRK
jgi:hypothetical protein